jgi:hypothetical protein
MDVNTGTNIGTNVRYITRYVKEHYVQKKIRRDLYERLVKWCGGDSVNICLERALNVLESSAGVTSTPNIGANIGTISGTTSTPNIDANATQAAEAARKERSGYVWCEKKVKIRSFPAFLKWVEKTYGLIDHWEEEDRYCFETLEPPKKSKKRGPEEVEGEALE